MKIKIIELSAFLALFVCIISCLSFENNCNNIRGEVLRLHVIANSDSAEDQSLKLQVRDRILLKGKELFSFGGDITEAEEEIKKNLGFLKNEAEKEVREKGYNYKVDLNLENCYFPTRQYENATLPAGEYKALRIVIGEGEGENWWCVLFPPMCLSAAKGELQLETILSEDEMKIVSSEPKYEIRFWLIEKFEEIKIAYKRRR